MFRSSLQPRSQFRETVRNQPSPSETASSMSTPPAKRQKLDPVEVFSLPTTTDPASQLTIRDLSFQTPLRKKLNLIFTQTSLEAHSAAKQELSVPLAKIKNVI